MRRVPLVIPLLVSLLSAAPASAVSYVFTTIDYGPFGTYLTGINDHGDIVGSVGPTLDGTGFLYRSGEVTPLSFSAQGINNHGDIVGFLHTENTVSILLTASGTVSTYGHREAWPYDDNPFGAVWFYDINDVGQIAGTANISSTPLAFVLNGDDYTFYGGWVGPFGNSGTAITGINNQEDVVATADTHCSCGGENALLYSSGVVQHLATPEEAHTTRADDINDVGQIAGAYSYDYHAGDFSSPWHGIVWRGDTFVTIDVPGASSTRLAGINNRGQVVGAYWGEDGVAHGFVATPVPEPATWLLWGSGAIVGLLWRMAAGFRRLRSEQPNA